MSKAQETNQLKAMASSVKSGSYLADLFTKEMVEWCETQIQQDFMPNLYAAYMAEVQHKTDLQGMVGGLQSKLNHAKDMYSDACERLERANELRTREQEKREGLLAELRERDAKVFAQREELLAKDAELTKLKAMLFDLQNA